MGAPLKADLKPEALAPYFWLAALIHGGAVASRFDLLAAKLPAGAPLAIMLAQFPILFLSGYFEGRLDHGESSKSMPLWMRIDSWPVKLAFSFGFIYLVVVAAQTWDISFGPVDPTPPKSFPPATRAMWFAMFTLGFSLIFFMVAAGVLIPILRFVTQPLRMVPAVVGALIALAVGAASGLVVMAAVQSTKIAEFIKAIKATIKSDPAVFIGVTLAVTFVPLLLGLLIGKRAKE